MIAALADVLTQPDYEPTPANLACFRAEPHDGAPQGAQRVRRGIRQAVYRRLRRALCAHAMRSAAPHELRLPRRLRRPCPLKGPPPCTGTPQCDSGGSLVLTASELRAALGVARRRGLESLDKEIGQAERLLSSLQGAPGVRRGISR